MYAGGRGARPDGTAGGETVAPQSFPDYAAQSAGDLPVYFRSRNRPCGLFGTAGDRRSGTRNEDSSGTPDGHCRHRFAAGYYRESDFGGDGCAVEHADRLPPLFARYLDDQYTFDDRRGAARRTLFAACGQGSRSGPRIPAPVGSGRVR